MRCSLLGGVRYGRVYYRGVKSFLCFMLSNIGSFRSVLAEAVQNHVHSLNWGHRVQLKTKYDFFKFL